LSPLATMMVFFACGAAPWLPASSAAAMTTPPIPLMIILVSCRWPPIAGFRSVAGS